MLKVTSLLPLLTLAACGLTPDPVDGDTGETNVTSGGATIQQIQMGDIAEDETVTLNGVIATSGPSSNGEGFFIQEPGGGEYSGIYVYIPAGLDELYIEAGYELNVTGTVTEYYDWTEFSVSSSTAIEVVGTGDVTVDSVDPATVTSWEVWESCLISVGPATVTEGTNSYGEIRLDNGLVVDDLFMEIDAGVGATFDDVIAPLGYSYEEWKLFPRSEDDLPGYVPAVVEPATIFDIQNGDATGSVELVDVVVTSQINYKGDGFFVQEQGGGEYSGLYIYLVGSGKDVDVNIGDVISLEGSISEYYDLTELTLADSGDLVASGGTADVTIDNVDPSSVSDWEPWESCLIDIGEVTATSDLNEYGEVTTDAGVKIDNMFFNFEASNGLTWEFVAGPLSYSYSEWKLNPRSEDDMDVYLP